MYVFAQVLSHYGLIGENIQNKVKIICPFHEDLKPSMLVDVVNDNYYCFGCQARGNSLDFIKHIEKCDDLKAMLIISKINNGNMDKRNISVSIQPKLTNKEAIEEAKFYFYTLPETDWRKVDNNNYLLKRGFNRQTMQTLDVRENYNHIYGVVAPMMDIGKFKGYVCRATVNEFAGEEVSRKYLYNKGFSRSDTLVGRYDKSWPVVTEGFLDYARLVQFGVENSCAILGWKATDRQISKLQQYTGKIISALDNTESGENGTKYLANYFDVVRFQFPDYIKDVGEMKMHEFNVAWRRTLSKIKSGSYIRGSL